MGSKLVVFMLIFGVQPQWFSDGKPFVQHLIRKPGRKDLKYGAGYATDYGTDYGEEHRTKNRQRIESGKGMNVKVHFIFNFSKKTRPQF